LLDLAILKISDPPQLSNPIPYTLRSLEYTAGDDVYILGFPLTASMGEEIKLTNGIISSTSGFMGDTRSYQVTAPVQPGNSGAPLFSKTGHIIGIATAIHKDAEDVTYAIKTKYLFELIDRIPYCLFRRS
jgi:S1-C subfamily serine protease